MNAAQNVDWLTSTDDLDLDLDLEEALNGFVLFVCISFTIY